MYLVNNCWKQEKDFCIFGSNVPLNFQHHFFSKLEKIINLKYPSKMFVSYSFAAKRFLQFNLYIVKILQTLQILFLGHSLNETFSIFK